MMHPANDLRELGRTLRATPLLLMASLSLCFLLVGCGHSPDDPDDCQGENGVLQVCATLFGEPAEGQALLQLNDSTGGPLEALLDDQGCTSIDLAPGSYEWAASSLSATCISAYEEATVEDCGRVTEVEVELDQWCQLGR